MNILFLTKELPFPPDSGHRVRTFNLLKGLSQQNKVTLVSFTDSERQQEKVKALKEYCVSVEIVADKISGSKWRLCFSLLLNLFSSIPFVVKRRYSARMRKRIETLLKKEKVTLIFCDSLYQVSHIPAENIHYKVLLEHNVESMIIYRYLKVERNIFKKIYALIEWLKMKRFENRIWRRFDMCLAVSESDKNIMTTRSTNENIKVIPNGVDLDYFCPQDAKVKPFSLIYTGQMGWYPNQDAVMYFVKEMYPLIKKDIPQVSFWIVGNNPSERIKKLAREDKSIIVTGFVEDVRPYIAQSSIFIVPLRIGSGTRLKILEAMAMRKPVISTSIGEEGLEVTNGENILIADKPQDFADCTVRLLKNKDLWNKLVMNGRKLVEEKYSWAKIVEKLNKICEEIKRWQ